MTRRYDRFLARALALCLLIGLVPATTPRAQPVRAQTPSELHVISAMSAHITAVRLQGSLAIAGDLRGLTLFDVSDPTRPFLVGLLDLGGEVTDLVVADTLVYVATYTAGFHIVDIANPYAPRLRGSLAAPYISAIDVTGDRAAITTLNGFQIIEVRNPDAPALFASPQGLSLGTTTGIRLVGDRVFVANLGGLSIYDSANPEQITLLSHYNSIEAGRGNGRGVDVVGDVAYLAVGASGLVLLDVSAPEAPRELGAIDTQGFTLAVQVTDGQAFLAEREGGFQLVDVRDPARPQLLDRIDSPGRVTHLDRLGDRVALAAGPGGLQLLALTGATVELQGAYLVGGDSTELAVAGDNLYLGNTDGLTLVDISTPARPQAVGNIELPGAVTTIAISGTLAFVGSTLSKEGNYRDERLLVVSLDDPTAPVVRAAITFPSAAVRDLLLVGSTLYVATANLGLQAVDVATPDAPVVLGAVPDVPSTYIDRINVSGSRAYLSSGEVLDISGAGMPRLLGTLDLSQQLIHDIEGTHLYVVERIYENSFPRPPVSQVRTTLKIVDVADLSAPRVLGSYSPPLPDARPPAEIWSVTVEGEVAYLATSGGIELFDIADPTSPRLVQAIPIEGETPRLLWEGAGFIFGGGYRVGLHIYAAGARFAPQSALVVGGTELSSSDGTTRVLLSPSAAGALGSLAQLERLTPSQAPGAERAVLQSMLVEGRAPDGASVDRVDEAYHLVVDMTNLEPLAGKQLGIAAWDGWRWVDLPRCADCTAQSDELAVLADRFGELAIVADALPAAPPTPGTPSPVPSPSPPPPDNPRPWRVHLPLIRGI